MSANNKRVRRAILTILWADGPLTKETLADRLQTYKSVRQVPSPNSLSALLCKNPQIVSVGVERLSRYTVTRLLICFLTLIVS